MIQYMMLKSHDPPFFLLCTLPPLQMHEETTISVRTLEMTVRACMAL